MTQVIIPANSIERIYPSENDVGNGAYNGVRGTEQNIANSCRPMRNGIISNRDGAGLSLGEGGFDMQAPGLATFTVTFNLGVAYINGFFINCIAADTVDLVLDSEKILYVYLKLVKAGGIVNDSGDPDGALKIVSSETPINIDDYVPLYRIETDDTEVIEYVDLRPRAMGIPTSVALNTGSTLSAQNPQGISSLILMTGFDQFNVLSGILFAKASFGLADGEPMIRAHNGIDTAIDSESEVGPPVIPALRDDDLYFVRLKIPTDFKPNATGLYQITPVNILGVSTEKLVTNLKDVGMNGSGTVAPFDYRSTWMLADW